jgi:HNH endonuclease
VSISEPLREVADVRSISGLSERFWAKVDKTAGLGPKGECWEWRGTTNEHGYGRIRVSRRSLLAHRVAWMLEHGWIPSSVHVLHKCDNPPCVRCLFRGNHKDNMADMGRKGRRSNERNPNTRLSPADLLAVISLRAEGLSFGEVGARFGISHTHARHICIGKKRTQALAALGVLRAESAA